MDSEKIILLVLGAIIGFIASIIKDILLENKKKKIKDKELTRDRLEELFKLLAELNEDILMPIESTKKHDTSRIAILIRFYFPQLHSEYKKFLTYYIEITKLKLEKKEFSDAHTKYSESLKILYNLIVEESKKI